MNPVDSYVLQEGDEVLVIAEDDDSYAPGLLRSEGKSAEEFNHSKVSREDSLLWLAARYGRYDNGNLALSQQSSQNMAGMAMCIDSGIRSLLSPWFRVVDVQ
nr:ion channel CASTOR-like isoform X1 [Ipomoea batatas]